MELLTPELRAEFPKLYTQDGNRNPTVYAKFFFPVGSWTWFVTEGERDDDDFRMFGFVIGFESEWGYFSLRELESFESHGLTVERDLFFQPGKFKEVIARERVV